ncbi:hypothetical protein L484_012081 [Morus notabilis]|uniref:Uncharacterized protein n=1 Tax=Morus notabilis TaxID=981085 RepID=W9RQ14_9ROSA|nr:hypothetical protein L484_012081 [Morus notabilis]
MVAIAIHARRFTAILVEAWRSAAMSSKLGGRSEISLSLSLFLILLQFFSLCSASDRQQRQKSLKLRGSAVDGDQSPGCHL